MNIEFTEIAWEDFSYWIDNDESIALKIKELISVINREPFKGIGKAEPLKFGLKGFCLRRISNDHSLVYRISGTKGIDQKCTIIQCRFHYDDK